MRIIKILIWSAACVGLGIFVSNYKFDGKTPVQHLERGWKQKPGLDEVKEDVSSAIDGAKKKLTVKEKAVEAPTEQHSEEDKEAVNRLLARRKQ